MATLATAQPSVIIGDGATIRIQGGAVMHIFSDNPNSILKYGNTGGIITDAEGSIVRLDVKDGTGEYYIPFCSSAGNTIPFIYEITTAGSADGYIDFTSYETTVANTPLPTTVVAISNDYGIDNSPYVVDRFWLIDTDSYTTKPKGEYTFTYDDNDLVGNLIDESLLVTQRWNDDDNLWGDWLYSPTVNTTSNDVTIVIANPEDQYRVWTLVDQGSPLAITIATFFGTCDDKGREIYWETWTELPTDTFKLERSYDGSTFEPFHTFAANGVPSSYTIYDTDPYEGIVYYRLNDEDIIVVYCDGRTDFIIRPNPNDGNFVIDHDGIHTFIVYDNIGKVVYRETTDDNRFNLSHLSSGQYYILISNREDNGFFRLMITK